MKLTDLNFVSGKYLAFELSSNSMQQLLKLVPASFPRVLCHHVTLAFPITETALEELKAKYPNPLVTATGHAKGKNIECFTVAIDGEVNRLDGSFYHVTHSLASGVKPVESNKLLQSKNGIPDLVFDRPLALEGHFKLAG